MTEKGEKNFVVRAMHVDNEARARLLEAILNRPEVVDRIMDEVAKKVKDATSSILWGYDPAIKSCEEKE